MSKNNFKNLPSNWKIKTIANVTDIKVGKDLIQKSFSEIKTKEYIYPVYSNSHVNYGLYGYYNFKEYTGNSVTVVGRGDVGKAFKRSGSFGAIGRLIVLFPNKDLDNNYLAECINYHVSFHQESSAIPQLTGKQIGTYSIPLPPFPEQQKIAEILSTVDDKIEIIDQQIIETQALKKGLMQQLLTKGIGHTEFKDSPLGMIPKSWEVVQIGDVLKLGSGKDYKHLSIGTIPVYGTGGIMTFVDSYLYDGESVGIGRKGTIDKPVFLKDKFWTVDTLFYTHSFNKVTPFYVYIVFQSIKWRGYSEATGVPSLSKNIIEPIKILLPPMEEQIKISNIFSSIDEKLEVLSEKKIHYQGLKQGLMQQLLTGKIRVKV